MPVYKKVFENWKTYTNGSYNYEIKFPTSWRTQVMAPGANDKEAGPDSVMVEIYRKKAADEYPFHRLSIMPFSLSEELTFEYLKKRYDSWTIKERTDSKQEVNKMSAHIIEGETSGDFYLKIYLFHKAEDNLLIEIMTRDTLGRQDKDVFEVILSTFKFLGFKNSLDLSDLHKPCGGNNPCAFGFQCLEYYGIGGEVVGKFKSCEIPCPNGDSDCPEGLTCGMIADGPGLVCSR
jgi:hypothetical protein